MSAAAMGRSVDTLHSRLQEYYIAAVDCVAKDRADAMMNRWIRRDAGDSLTDARLVAMMADAVLLSTDLLVSQPSLSGTTAFDRLSRKLGKVAPLDATALRGLCAGRFGLFRVLTAHAGGGARVRDLNSDRIVTIEAPDFPPMPADTIVFGRLVATGPASGYLIGAITPLDTAALAAATAHQAAGSQTPVANARWAEAIYAHVVRYGTLDIPGLNRPTDDERDHARVSDLDPGLLDLAGRWADLGSAAPDARLLLETRQLANVPGVLETLYAVLVTRENGNERIATGFERIVSIQLETVHLRMRSGAGAVTLDGIASAIDHQIANHSYPREARDLFVRLRPRLSEVKMAGGADPALERLVQRIQGLRAKTVAQGCTEQEAMAAAEKVAELLDRYGLSLSELEFQAQPCEGIGIQTDRRRLAPIDDCMPAIAAFFDCRVWVERPEHAGYRYVFFGLRADVVAAQYLYELVERAFETETALFRRGDLYREMAGERRSATNSFQIGLARGIVAKLRTLRQTRDEFARSASGRDLVPIKAAMVEDELAKLGLNLKARSGKRNRTVISDAYAVGVEAGEKFEVVSAIAS